MPGPWTAFHLDSERGLRGGERQLLYLAAELRRRGHANVVVCRPGAPLDAAARRLGLEVLSVSPRGEWDPFAARALARAAARRPGALLHAHTAHAAALAALARRLGGPPWVAHRRVDFALNGGLSRRLKYGSAAAFIAVSAAIQRVLAEGGVAADRVTVVPDALPLGPEESRLAGLDAPWGPAADRAALKRALGERLSLDPAQPWVGNLAALVPHKDQATLLRAAALVVRDVPRARFVLVGDGPERAALEALSESLGMRGAVRFAGRQEDPRPWLQALDAYCQSSWGEGMGSVLLEAMACRVPIAATTAGGIPEVLADGRTALLAPPRDPAALAAALVRTLSDPADAAARAAAAAAALERFSLARMGESVERVYAGALPEAACS